MEAYTELCKAIRSGIVQDAGAVGEINELRINKNNEYIDRQIGKI